jgi:spore photoproduct lyase
VLESCQPVKPEHFEVERIVLAKRSVFTAQRHRFVKGICGLYPDAEVIECPDSPHNRVNLQTKDPLELHLRGKRTLVFGEHKSAVRLSREEGNTCPNYWHFSPYGFCPHGCHYCYLAGTQGVRFSPTVKIFLNLQEILLEIDRVACELAKPTAFYLGKLQDGLALDPLTGYSRALVSFFARHPYARMTLLTKSAEVANLLDLDHKGNTILSWSLNPAKVISQFETNTPQLHERVEAMKACGDAGYRVRAVIMPVIPVSGWQSIYDRFLEKLLVQVQLERITLGGVCIYRAALDLMERKLGKDNAISQALSTGGERCADGRARYPESLRVEIYGHIIKKIRQLKPDLTIGLCLEEKSVFEALDLTESIGRCNCVL